MRRLSLGVLPGRDFLAGGGEMGAMMRAFDWSTTSLGPPGEWPQRLRSIVNVVLTSRFAMWMGWGPDLSFFYNDAYAPTLGVKHGWALGRPSREVWSEIWGDIGPRLVHVLTSGDATWDEALQLFLRRNGYAEETYHTFSYSPLLDDDGTIAGSLCVVSEETDRIIGDRRLRTLRELAAYLAAGGDEAQVLQTVRDALASNPQDLPFSLTYLWDEDGSGLTLAASTGFASDAAAMSEFPPSLVAAEWAGALWGGAPRVDIAWAHADSRPRGAWQSAPLRGLAVPIARPGAERPAGLLLVGLNPHRQLDSAYTDFVGLIAGQIASGLGNARAREAERRRAAALAELDRAKTDFFSNVSHEFRTPLTLMLNLIEELLVRAPRSAQDRDLLDVAHRNALRLLRLVNSLLDFSRIEAGRAQATYEPVDLALFTADLASAFRSVVETAGLALHVDAPPLAGPVFVDRDMWEKIVLNLLSNAFKFTFEGSIAVRVAATPDRSAALVTVEDTGTGIPEAELAHLFKRFHRVRGARGRSIEGSGIGLALVQELVHLHGGTIAVASRVGQGTAFTITLPFGTSHLVPEQVRDEPSGFVRLRAEGFVAEAKRWLPGSSGAVVTVSDVPDSIAGQRDQTLEQPGRVVLADDNADMRSYVERLLSEAGFAVAAVSDGQQALTLVRATAPDLVVADVMMPSLDGFALLAAVRADPATRDIPIILLSARAGEEARVEARHAGADEYLVKPFNARELVATLGAHLRLLRLRRAGERKMAAQKRILELIATDSPVADTLRAIAHFVEEQAPQATVRIEVGTDHSQDVTDGGAGAARVAVLAADGQRIAALAIGGDGAARGAVDAELVGTAVQLTSIALERDRHARALEESAARLRRAQQAGHIVDWTWNVQTDALSLEGPVEAVYGIAADAMPRTTAEFQARFPQGGAARLASAMAPLFAGRLSRFETEFPFRDQVGGIRWIAARAEVQERSPEGRPLRVVGVTYDVTARKTVEETLERRVAEAIAGRKILADIVEGTDAFVQVVDLDFRWLAINKASAAEFERIFGIRPAVGMSMQTALAGSPRQQAEVLAVWSRALSGEEFVEVGTFGDPARDRRHYEMKFNTLRDQNGRRIGAYQFVYDVTERIQSEARLAETQAQLHEMQKLEVIGQLTGGIAHDFNNLLTPIYGVLDLLQYRLSPDERLTRMIGGAMQSAERARVLVGRLLAFARRQHLEARAVAVPDLVRGMMELIDHSLGPTIDVVVDLATDLPLALVDPNQLELALLNLCVNARDAMPDGGRLRIAADTIGAPVLVPAGLRAGRYIRLRVIDTGVGMDPETLRRAIEPFFTSKELGKGTGLGLSMVHGLAAQSGGALTLDSNPGQGTTATLYLPVAVEQDSPRILPVPERRRTGPIPALKILLVDDEELVRAGLRDLLESMGHKVVDVPSGVSALQLLRRDTRIDLLITDYMMPSMDGVTLVHSARGIVPGLSALLITGYAAATDAKAGHLPRLNKPFSEADLAAAIVAAVG